MKSECFRYRVSGEWRNARRIYVADVELCYTLVLLAEGNRKRVAI